MQKSLLWLLFFFGIFNITARDSEILYRQFDFHYAVAKEDVLEVERFLEAGADPNVIPSDLLSQELGEDFWYSLNSVVDESPLAMALRTGNRDMIDLLLNHGANPGLNRKTLRAALDWGYSDVALKGLQTLAERNGGVLPDEYLGGDSPLAIEAARRGYGDVVGFLLDHGEALSVSENYGLDLFFSALQGNLPHIVELFLDQGRDVNSVTPRGQTALDMAVLSASGDALLLLLERGVDFEPDSLSRRCVFSGLFDITQKIYNDYPDITYDYTKALWNAALTGDSEIIEFYRNKVKMDEYLNFQFNGNNFLHTAATGGYLPLIKEIVESGRFDPLDVTENSSPAYLAAVLSHNPEAVRYFLSLGWDPNEESGDITALSSLVFDNPSDVNLEIVQILLEAGADPLFKINDGSMGNDSPLGKAISYGKPRILELFLKNQAVREYLEKDTLKKALSLHNATSLDDLIDADYRYFKGDFLDVCRLLLENQADLGSDDYRGLSPMAYMVIFRDLSLFSVMLEYPDRPGIREGIKQSMVLAAEMGRFRFLDKLLQNGISPDFTIKNDSPLGAAVEAGVTESVRMLLEAGADPNCRSTDNKIPLELVEPENSEIRNLLLSYGAVDPSDQPFGSEDLIIAVRGGDPDGVYKLIQKGADPNAAGKEGLVPMEIAAGAGDRAMVELLIKNGADLNRTGSVQIHPLRKALENRHYDLFSYLLKEGADPCENSFVSMIVYDVIKTCNIPLISDTLQYGKLQDLERLFYSGGERSTMLHIAVDLGNLDTVGYFINLGASVNTPDESGRTPLMSAAAHGDVPMMELLLDSGADPNLKANELQTRQPTALMAASFAGSSSCVKLLLDAGADTSIQNYHGENALDMAQGSSVRTLLQNAGAKFAVNLDGILANAVHYYDYVGVLDALMKGADPDSLNSDGYPVLFTAVGQGFSLMAEISYFMVDALLTAGADPNARNRNHSTPLFDAVGMLRGPELGLLILKYGGDPCLENQFGKTAYDEDMMVEEKSIQMFRFYKAILDGCLEECQRLRDKYPGFDLNYADYWGRTLLMLAFEEEQVEIAAFLIDQGANTTIKSRIFPGYLADPPSEASLLEKLSKPGMMTLKKLAGYKENPKLQELLDRARRED